MNNFLVSTSQSLILINSGTFDIKTIHHGSGLYYGICSNQDFIFVASRNRQVSSRIPRSREKGNIKIFTHKLDYVDTLYPPFALRDIHEIKWHQNKLWITCSYDDLIVIWDGHNWIKWFPEYNDYLSPKDLKHYNSICFDSNIIYLLAHRWGKSMIYLYDINSLKFLSKFSLGVMSHNLWFDSGSLHTCSSHEGTIITRNKVIANPGGFTRGYSSNDEYRIVGKSEIAERSKRDYSFSQLVVYRLDWSYVSHFSLGRLGLVLDIQNITLD